MTQVDNTLILYNRAFKLALFTILFNTLEGLVSIFFGYSDQSLTLFGFGVDSFIEVISGLGIAHMVLRIRRNPTDARHNFEKTALRITGLSFYSLVLGLIVTSINNLIKQIKPETTTAGVIISLISIFTMVWLKNAKSKVGKDLNSSAILADAECTQVCIYMSIVLLLASAIYELTKISYVDIIGSLGLAYFSFTEGREYLEKAARNKAERSNDE